MYIKPKKDSTWWQACIAGKVVAHAPDLESAIHALWVTMGRSPDYTLEYESETGIVHKRKTELPTKL